MRPSPTPTSSSRRPSSSAATPPSAWSRARCSPPTTRRTGKLTITTSSQCPHMIQHVFARTLGIPQHNVQIIAPDVGGSFGLKIHTYGDELADHRRRHPARPPGQVRRRPPGIVRVRHPRAREHRQGPHRGQQVRRHRGLRHRRAVGRRRLFAIPAHQRVRGHPGAQHHRRSLPAQALPGARHRGLPEQGADLAVSRRRPPDRQQRSASTWSIRPPTGSASIRSRCAGATSCPTTAIPTTSASGIKLKDLSHQRCLDALVERMDYAGLREEQARLREKGIHRGIGIATFIKGTAPGPHGYYGAGGAPISLQDACVIKLEPNGGVICAVGVTDQGQGVDTVMGQIAAAALGVPIDSVRVLSGDTDATPVRRRHLCLARHRHRRRGRVPGRARPAPGDPASSPACCCRPSPTRSTSSTARSSIAATASSACRSPRSAASATTRSASCPTACSRCSRTPAASAWSTTSTSSPTASTAPTSRSTPTPASSAC